MPNSYSSRAFNPFAASFDEEESPTTTSGWQDGNAWGGTNMASAVDTSFDSQSLFVFSATSAILDPEDGFNLFPEDPMASMHNDFINDPSIHVVIRENFSALYDDSSKNATFHIDGSIIVQPSQSSMAPFFLVVKDEREKIAGLNDFHEMCKEVTKSVPKSQLEKGDRVLRVHLPRNPSAECLIAKYRCVSSLRPIPMLVKSRVQVMKSQTRVGFKIRANPSNTRALSNVVVLLAVPPVVIGDTVKMSRQGGVWDSLKRTICWTIDEIKPGICVEIQAQFDLVDMPQELDRIPKFPIMVRAESDVSFSGIDLEISSPPATIKDAKHAGPKLHQTQIIRIIHRKV